MAKILADEAVGLRVVLHAFTGASVLAELGARLGFWFGIGGFVTFKNHPLASCVRDLPRESLLLETDAPYLAPHPVRGQRNEPGHVLHVARRLGDILGCDATEVAALTSANYTRFLGGAIDPAARG
jgi:TatD DNase family protein